MNHIRHEYQGTYLKLIIELETCTKIGVRGEWVTRLESLFRETRTERASVCCLGKFIAVSSPKHIRVYRLPETWPQIANVRFFFL